MNPTTLAENILEQSFCKHELNLIMLWRQINLWNKGRMYPALSQLH